MAGVHFNRFNLGERDFVTPGMQLKYISEAKAGKPAVIAISKENVVSEISWKELHVESNRIAWLLAEHGVTKDSNVIVAFTNCILHVACAYAIWKLGACYTAISAKTSCDEVEGICRLLSPELVLADIPVPDSVTRFSAADLISRITAYPEEMPPDTVAAPSRAFLSGGTSGQPKIIQNMCPEGYDDQGIRELFRRSGQQFEQRQLLVGPLFHTAPNIFLFSGLFLGNTIIMPERFGAEQMVKHIVDYQIQFVMLVPIMMYRILKLENIQKEQFRSITALTHTGGPCSVSLKQAWIDLLAPEKVHEIYSMTEGLGLTIIRGDEWMKHRGSVGRPLYCEIMICDDKGNALGANQVGEIYMRSGHPLPTRYIGHEQVAETAEGYRSVGDMGYLDEDGYLYYVDRRCDMIVTGGENVFVSEVESILMRRGDITDVVLLGVPDAEWGRSIHAVIETSASLSARELTNYLSERILPYKIPKKFYFTTHIPRMENGKVNRSTMLQQYLSRLVP